jgi:hypothetical protein
MSAKNRPARLASAALFLFSGMAFAGGPLFLDQEGNILEWSTAQPIAYRTDGGNLSTNINNAAAIARVESMFDVWQAVPSSNISYAREGAILSVPGFSDGDVNTAAEFNAVEGDCFQGDQSPIVFDVNGSLFEDLGQDSSVIGFAGPCAANAAGKIVSGRAVMNGIFLDGINTASNPELTPNGFDAAFIHEFGHFSGLDHSQVNLDCLLAACGTSALAGLPTMFPFLIHDSMNSLSPDDIAWISRLYPQAGGGGFNATHGTITGVVRFSDGISHAQLVNVIARRVGQENAVASSAVSGYRFRFLHGNPIANSPDPSAGSDNAAQLGLFEIPVPAGSYRLEVEEIFEEFVDGSSVGPGLYLIPLPGTAPPPSAQIGVSAGETEDDHDVVLNGTPPRYDEFETGP